MFSLGRFDWRTAALVVVVAVTVIAAMLLLAEGGEPRPARNTQPATPTTPAPTQLLFAVWGAEEEVAAYEQVVSAYNVESQDVDVEVRSWPTADEMMAAIRSGEVEPDLFLLRRQDLAEAIESGLNRPLLDLLDARGILLGDDFHRDAVAAFSANDDLQCMPYGSSPMVIYYNTDLVDFERMEARELPVPGEEREEWTLEEFRAAAEFASRPRRQTSGVHIEPSLRALAPFIYSGGGGLFDDEAEPTSLALAQDDSAEALRATLEVLRDPRLTLSNEQLRRKSALEWFQEGRLGMIAGFRELTPVLRRTPGLEFDVMPMPVIDSSETVGDLTGVCVAGGNQAQVEHAADFLVHLVSDEAVAEVAEVGYLMPTNLTVAFSDAFLQQGRAPRNARAFNRATRDIVLPPLMQSWDELERAVAPELERLLTQPVLEDLEAALAEIDEQSRRVLEPEDLEPTDGPGSPGPTEDNDS